MVLFEKYIAGRDVDGMVVSVGRYTVNACDAKFEVRDLSFHRAIRSPDTAGMVPVVFENIVFESAASSQRVQPGTFRGSNPE